MVVSPCGANTFIQEAKGADAKLKKGKFATWS
nr:MAG TPA: protein of unknown function (DUF951) [Caudoviricetes sp.]